MKVLLSVLNISCALEPTGARMDVNRLTWWARSKGQGFDPEQVAYDTRVHEKPHG